MNEINNFEEIKPILIRQKPESFERNDLNFEKSKKEKINDIWNFPTWNMFEDDKSMDTCKMLENNKLRFWCKRLENNKSRFLCKSLEDEKSMYMCKRLEINNSRFWCKSLEDDKSMDTCKIFENNKSAHVGVGIERDRSMLTYKCFEDVKSKAIPEPPDIGMFSEILERDHSFLNSKIFCKVLINRLSEHLNTFSLFYQTNVRNKFIDNIKTKSFGVIKVESNCICLSINILNNLIKLKKPSTMDFVFSLVEDLRVYSNSIPLARRLLEMSLYCLCNYYHYNSSVDQNETNYLTSNKRLFENIEEDIYNLFLESNSQKIKISSSIILSLNKSTKCSDGSILTYLELINENHFKNSIKNDYYGIKQDLILNSISTSKE